MEGTFPAPRCGRGVSGRGWCPLWVPAPVSCCLGLMGVQRLPFHRNLCLMALRSVKVNDVLAFSLNEISRQGFSDTMYASY